MAVTRGLLSASAFDRRPRPSRRQHRGPERHPECLSRQGTSAPVVRSSAPMKDWYTSGSLHLYCSSVAGIARVPLSCADRNIGEANLPDRAPLMCTAVDIGGFVDQVASAFAPGSFFVLGTRR